MALQAELRGHEVCRCKGPTRRGASDILRPQQQPHVLAHTRLGIRRDGGVETGHTGELGLCRFCFLFLVCFWEWRSCLWGRRK
jgi:hypothetical protein